MLTLDCRLWVQWTHVLELRTAFRVIQAIDEQVKSVHLRHLVKEHGYACEESVEIHVDDHIHVYFVLPQNLESFAILLTVNEFDGLLQGDDAREHALKIPARHLQHSPDAIDVDVHELGAALDCTDAEASGR